MLEESTKNMMNAEDGRGLTPLHLASSRGNLGAAKLLVEMVRPELICNSDFQIDMRRNLLESCLDFIRDILTIPSYV